MFLIFVVVRREGGDLSVDNRKLISVVSACYNEVGTIALLAQKVKDLFDKIPDCDYQIIFVDDFSTDGSREELVRLSEIDPKIKVVFLSRNFGNPQYCYLAGMSIASGDAVVFIDADLQHPVHAIMDFIAKWKEGYVVVYSMRRSSPENIIRRIGYYLFYRIWGALVDFKIPKDAGDFCLLDRRVVDIILQLPEKDVFLRGLRSWVGFKQTGIVYDGLPRLKGVTKFNFLSYVRTAKDAFVNFSVKPLEFISFIAIGSAIFTAAVAAMFLFLAFTSEAPRGFFTFILAILFFGTIQLVALGVIAEYLIRIFREVKGRPSFIIEKVISKQNQGRAKNHE